MEGKSRLFRGFGGETVVIARSLFSIRSPFVWFFFSWLGKVVTRSQRDWRYSEATRRSELEPSAENSDHRDGPRLGTRR